MPQSIHRYRGYLIGLEWKHGVLLVSVSPATPDLPILGRCIDTSTRCESEAMVEAKNRVDRALFKLRQYVSDVSVDSQYS